MGIVKFPSINKFDLLQVVLVLTSWTKCANWARYLRCVAFRIQIEFGNRALPFFVPLLKLRSDNRCQNQFLMSLWTDPQCLFGWTISKHLTLGFGIDRCCFRRPDARSNITDFGKFWNSVVQCNAAIIWCLTYRPSLNIMTDWLILTTNKHLNYSNDFDLHLPTRSSFFLGFVASLTLQAASFW